MGRFTGTLGILAILTTAWLFSTHRRSIRPRVIFWGLGLQFLFAVLVLKTDFGKIFQAVGVAVNAMLNYDHLDIGKPLPPAHEPPRTQTAASNEE